jgi:hypothetical protein
MQGRQKAAGSPTAPALTSKLNASSTRVFGVCKPALQETIRTGFMEDDHSIEGLAPD